MTNSVLIGQKRRVWMGVLILGCVFAGGFWAGLAVARDRGLPFFIIRQSPWSIGIYEGSSPFKFSPAKGMKNPVLRAEDVTDVSAEFVVDPFLVREGEAWYLFFEVMNRRTSQGDIGLATSSDGLHWTYQKIVLDEPFHLSYPYVFKWQDGYYLIPESAAANAVRLYKAERFPDRWVFAGTLLEGKDYSDPAIVRFSDYWWLFVTPQWDQDALHLFFAKELTGPWLEHPKSPVVQGDAHHARPGGRFIVHEGRVIRYAQDTVPVYGHQVHAFEILELTPTAYREQPSSENPVVKSGGAGWKVTRMHHVSPQLVGGGRWIAAVDGYGTRWEFDWRS